MTMNLFRKSKSKKPRKVLGAASTKMTPKSAKMNVNISKRRGLKILESRFRRTRSFTTMKSPEMVVRSNKCSKTSLKKTSRSAQVIEVLADLEETITIANKTRALTTPSTMRPIKIWVSLIEILCLPDLKPTNLAREETLADQNMVKKT